MNTADKLAILAVENDVLKRKQKLLDMDDTLIEKEEELSQRSKELENYEKEVISLFYSFAKNYHDNLVKSCSTVLLLKCFNKMTRRR